MADSSAFSGFGTTLEKGAQAIGEITNISGPSMSRDTIDVTSHDSDDTAREFIAGLIDAGEVSIEMNWVPGDTGQAALLSDFEDGSRDAYTLTFPDSGAATIGFDALITGFELGAPIDDKVTLSVTMKVCGKCTITP